MQSPNISKDEVYVVIVNPILMDNLKEYLLKQVLPSSKEEAQQVK